MQKIKKCVAGVANYLAVIGWGKQQNKQRFKWKKLLTLSQCNYALFF